MYQAKTSSSKKLSGFGRGNSCFNRQCPAVPLTMGSRLPFSPGKVLTMGWVEVSSLCSGRTQPTPCSFLLLFLPFSPFPSQIGPISLCTPVPATVLRAGSLWRWWLGQLLAPQSPLSSRTASCDFQSSGVYFSCHISGPHFSGSPHCSDGGLLAHNSSLIRNTE